MNAQNRRKPGETRNQRARRINNLFGSTSSSRRPRRARCTVRDDIGHANRFVCTGPHLDCATIARDQGHRGAADRHVLRIHDVAVTIGACAVAADDQTKVQRHTATAVRKRFIESVLLGKGCVSTSYPADTDARLRVVEVSVRIRSDSRSTAMAERPLDDGSEGVRASGRRASFPYPSREKDVSSRCPRLGAADRGARHTEKSQFGADVRASDWRLRERLRLGPNAYAAVWPTPPPGRSPSA